MNKVLGKQGEGYVVIQFLLFGLLFFAPRWAAFGEDWGERWTNVGLITGAILMLAAVGFIVAGMVHLGENLTAVPHPKENGRLVQSGAYAVVRHPIYSGIILGAFGWGLVNASLLTLLLAIVLLVFFDIKSRQEERWLREKFDDYTSYQKRVKKLVPFLY